MDKLPPFAVVGRIFPIHTGATVSKFGKDDGKILMRAGSKFSAVDSKSGSIVSSVDIEGEGITSYTAGLRDEIITCAVERNMIEVWSLERGNLIRSFKAQSSPVMSIIHHTRRPLLVTASADCVVRVWDSDLLHCTHNFIPSMASKKMGHSLPASCLSFAEYDNILNNSKNQDSTTKDKTILLSGSEDGSVCIWSLDSNTCIKAFKTAHSSAVVALDVFDGLLLTAGRDKIVNIFDMETGVSLLSLATLEVIEAAGFVDSCTFYTAGSKGVLRYWSISRTSSAEKLTASVLKTSDILCGAEHILTAVHMFSDHIVTFSSDLQISVLDLSSIQVMKRFVGDYGEITDISFITHDLMAVATSGPELRIISSTSYPEHSTTSGKISNDDFGENVKMTHMPAVLCLITGHSQAIVSLSPCVSVAGHSYILSGSRDHDAILWCISSPEKWSKVCTLSGHTDTVTAVSLAFDQQKSILLIVTASADATIKHWTVKASPSTTSPVSVWTVKAHEKDINSIIITPDLKKVITASQDRSAKAFSLEEGTFLGVFSGHKRGIWAAALSPIEQVLVTASADSTVRLWSTRDFKCLRVIESTNKNSSNSSVLRVIFSPDGTRLITATGDGLLRVWDVSTGEIIGSVMDEHPDKIWSMALVPSKEKNDDLNDDGNRQEAIQIITGDASGTIVRWKDVTIEQAESKREREHEKILQGQKLSNMIARKDFKSAALLAFQMEQPARLFSVISELVDKLEIDSAIGVVQDLVLHFNSLQEDSVVERLLKYVREWNTSMKRAYIAQILLGGIIRLKLNNSSIVFSAESLGLLGQIKAYTDRHFSKVGDLLIQSYMLDFCIRDYDAV